MTRSINPTADTAVLAALEGAINRALELAPSSKSQLAELEDHVFLVQCTSPEIDLYLEADQRGIRLMGIYEGHITTTVRGTASDFTELAASDDPAASLINGKLTIDGDSAPLLELQKIVGALDLDWEAPLVNVLGDVVGHHIAQILRGTFKWGRQASDSLTRQLDEFIHEEARLSPPRLELEDFYRDIQELTLRTERLQSRTDRLRKRMNQHAS
ncbi:MAG: ubiquinone biosynthesis protein UbiJ [Halioglobus sp.]|jgi:ubiquinone biosynthesis protein UbiJ